MHRHFRPARGEDFGISDGDIVVVHDENLPRGLWRLGKVEELMVGADGNVRCVTVKIASRNRSPISVKRPLQRLYPLELRSEDESGRSVEGQDGRADREMTPTVSNQDQDVSPARETAIEGAQPRRRAFSKARDTIHAWCKDL